ncbi:MAG: serine/threonine-protein kinase, partial [Acidimicrobiales bacterium]
MSGMTDQLGRVLGGRYRLTAPVGTGSSAQVFLADDVTLRRRVAVKVLHPALAGDEAFLRRFRAEARAAAALSHPNLMAVYDWGEDDGPYLVLEFLGGGSLRSMLDAGTRLTPSQAVVVGLDAARALDAAHRRTFVHRDIKPANLLFGDDARLRIADFGLARALSEAAWTEPGDGLVGTARYAAPEQAASPRIDGKADIYSLGLVLIEAVTGNVPLTADTALGTLMRRVDSPVPVPESMGPLTGILERAGRTDPADRPDAGELARGLLAAASDLDRPAPLPLAGAVVAGNGGLSADPTLLPGSVVDLRDRSEDAGDATAVSTGDGGT